MSVSSTKREKITSNTTPDQTSKSSKSSDSNPDTTVGDITADSSSVNSVPNTSQIVWHSSQGGKEVRLEPIRETGEGTSV